MVIKMIRELVGICCRIGGLFSFVYHVLFLKRVLILVYHDPTLEVFESHIDFLSKRFTFISLDQLIDACINNTMRSIPIHSCVITFDDGRVNNYNLLSVFKKYAIFPTIYLCSGIVNTQRHFWWKTAISSVESLKKMPYKKMLSNLELQSGFSPIREYPDRQALNAAELLTMLPFVNFGAHTRFHPVLTNCDNSTCHDEINVSKKEIENLIGKPICHFAFPNGNYSKREALFVKDAGYLSARTIKYGTVSSLEDLYSLHAIEIDDCASLNVLRAELIGLNALIKSALMKIGRS